MFTPALSTKPSCHSLLKELTQSAERLPRVMLSPKHTMGADRSDRDGFFRLLFKNDLGVW